MVMTTEQNIQVALADIFAAIPGVRHAYNKIPMGLQELPAVVILPGQATPTGKQAPRYMEVARVYRIIIYVNFIQAGETGVAEGDTVPFIQAGALAILQHPSLGSGTETSLAPWVMTMRYLGDSGTSELTFNGEKYIGIQFNAQITYKIPYEFSSFE